MKTHFILPLMAVELFLICGILHPCSFVEIPRREIVRSSAVVTVATVTAVNGQTGQRIAYFTIKEFLKGKLAKTFLDVPFIEKAEGPCGGTVKFDLGSEYILFLRKKANGEEFAYPGYIKISKKTTIENIKRFVRIAETEDMEKWRIPYLEIFQSGEFEFFMEAYEALVNLRSDKQALEKGLMEQWSRLAGEEWKRTFLMAPLVEQKSKVAIPYFKERAQHGSSWNFRIDAMKDLIALQADNLIDLFYEISHTDPDAFVRRAAYENIAKLSGKSAGEYFYYSISNEKDPWTRSELLRQLADMNHPATYDLALKALASRSSTEKGAAYAAFAKLRDIRAYPLLLKEFDSADVLNKRELMNAIIAIDDEAASQFLTSRLDGKDSLEIMTSLGNSKSPGAFTKLNERLVSELLLAEDSDDPNASRKHLIQIRAITESLIRIDSLKAKAIVLPLTEYSNLNIRYAIISTLGRMKAPWAFEKLQERLSDGSLAGIAATALLEIDYEKAIPTVLQLLKDNKLHLTPDLRETFAQHREQRSLMILESALHDAEDSVSRSYLQDAIMRIKSNSPDPKAN